MKDLIWGVRSVLYCDFRGDNFAEVYACKLTGGDS